MAGRFEGVSDLEWRLFEDVFPPAPAKRGRGMPHAPFRKIMKPPRSKLRGITRKGIVCETPRFLTLFPLAHSALWTGLQGGISVPISPAHSRA